MDRAQFESLDREISEWLEKEGLAVLRYSLAVIFIWFGILKPLGVSPAAGLAAETVPWIGEQIWIPLLGFWEVAIGICFLYKPLIRVAIPLLALHMAGTFLPFVLLPGTTFIDFPFVLTLEGQYIVKNLVLIGAAMVIGGHVRD